MSSLASWVLIGRFSTLWCVQPVSSPFKHDERVSGKADGFSKAPLLCSEAYGLTELEGFVLFLLAIFAQLAFADLLFAAMCRGIAHIGVVPRAFGGFAHLMVGHCPRSQPGFVRVSTRSWADLLDGSLSILMRCSSAVLLLLCSSRMMSTN